ncbi:MAG: ATPase, T2SS/T4P/T4SS family [Actinomycetota bacterium]
MNGRTAAHVDPPPVDPLHVVLKRAIDDQPHLGDVDLLDAARAANPLADVDELDQQVSRWCRMRRGLGDLEPLLADPTVDEVMINGPGPIWVERAGQLQPAGPVVGAEQLEVWIERMLDPLGLRVDPSQPWADARLADGSRLNVIVPPLALDGPTVTIRCFRPRRVGLQEFGPSTMVDQLVARVRGRRSMVVVGPTSSGKTSLLNALSADIDPHERVVTVEDTAELRLAASHVVRLESRPANAEGIGAVSLRQLLRNALRMRPDRIVVGEVRGAEALDLVLALSTGHAGSLTTCHAADAPSALRRLEALAAMGDHQVPAEALRAMIWAAVHTIVVVERRGPGRQVGAIVDLDPSGRLRRVWPVEPATRDGRA